MIKVDEDKIWITVNYTVNLGNFEFIKLEAGMSRSYDNEKPLKAIEELTDDILDLITQKGEDARELLTPDSKLIED